MNAASHPTVPRLRVLHVGKFYPPVRGGMEKVLQVIAEAERGEVDNHVLVANSSARTAHEVVDGVAVTRVASLTKVGAVALCPTFPLWLRRLDADIIVVHEPNPVALVAHLLARPRGKVVFWVHAEVVRPAWRYKLFYRPFLVRLLNRAVRIVAASPPVVERALELQPYRGKCVVIPYAINSEPCRPTPQIEPRVEDIRRESPLPVVLFVGRLVAYKGVDVLLRAVAITTARAIIVGDGPLRVELEQMAAGLGIRDRVRFAGNADTSEVAALYDACDLLVLPSVTRAEAFGMVQLEAMSWRKPVVSTALDSGVPWVNQHGITGLVVPPGDPAALGAAIQHLIDNPAERIAMGRRGRARVEQEFSIARLTQQVTDLYRSVAPMRGPSTATGVTVSERGRR